MATAIIAFFALGLIGLIRAATTVDLGRADNFAILASSTVTNVTVTFLALFHPRYQATEPVF